MLSRQIYFLCSFSSQRTCDRRLLKLLNAGFIKRHKIIYGIPYLYFVTEKAKRIFELEFITKVQNIRIDQITHDIAIADVTIYLMNKLNLSLDNFTTERRLKHSLGFSNNKHCPDLLFTYQEKKYCVEIELSVKSFERISNIVKDNFHNYDEQLWYINSAKPKIMQNLSKLKQDYGFSIHTIEEVTGYVKELQAR